MATFTMELHRVLGVDTPYDADASRIGLDRYPIWDEGYRGELNQKIIMRFWNREIGYETPDMFVHHMRRLMGEIMPYYSELAKTTLLDYDPFETLNITNESDTESQTDAKGTSADTSTSQTDTETESESTEQSESTQQNSSENSSRTVNSEHPQTRLNEYEDYATASADAVSESVSDSSGQSSGTGTQSSSGQNLVNTDQSGETSTEQRATNRDRSQQRGFQGDRSQLLQAYRDTIIGVDTLILEELEVLFMGVWDTDQSYTRIESPYPYHRLLF